MINNVLIHHGVKGQRWGVRRYQNADGTRTSAGKRRTSESSSFDDKFRKREKSLSSKEKADIGGNAKAYSALRTAGVSKGKAQAISWGINAVALALTYGAHKVLGDSPEVGEARLDAFRRVGELATYKIASDKYDKSMRAGVESTDKHLQHHGIKGQRWGVRRYQRPDGSLTPEGKKRASKIYSDYYTKGTDDLRKAQSEIIRKSKDDANKAYDDVQDRVLEKHHHELTDRQAIKLFNAIDEAYDLQLSASKVKHTADFVKNNENFQQALKIAKTYRMDEWDKLASSTKKQIEAYSNTNVNVDVVSEVMKKHY